MFKSVVNPNAFSLTPTELDREIRTQQQRVERQRLPVNQAILFYGSVPMFPPHMVVRSHIPIGIKHESSDAEQLTVRLAQQGSQLAANWSIPTFAMVSMYATLTEADEPGGFPVLATFGMSWRGAAGYAARRIIEQPRGLNDNYTFAVAPQIHRAAHMVVRPTFNHLLNNFFVPIRHNLKYVNTN